MYYDDYYDEREAERQEALWAYLQERGIVCEYCEEPKKCSCDGSCYGCHQATATTSFLDRPLCKKCYNAIRHGRYVQDTGNNFANPGSALRASGPGNPRCFPCPTCGAENTLTPLDKRRGYQCDHCADRAERGWDY